MLGFDSNENGRKLMMLLLTQQNRWSRRDAKKNSQQKFRSDNRKSVRDILSILVQKAKKIKENK